jgi:hypothetical protein
MTMARQWTVMVYMAGDTGLVFEGPITGEQLFDDLSDAMRADLKKMEAAGSTDEVAVCVQFDSLEAKQAFRWVLPRRDDPTPAQPEPIGAVNTGEPSSLSDFAAWAGKMCPAAHYALIIWGHGSGWDEQDLYARYPDSEVAQIDRADQRDVLRRRGIFGSTVARIMSIEDSEVRGLCYDDSARDFLDNAELRQALRTAAAHLGRDHIDLLGLDACLMNMIEVAHQIRRETAYLVGAETVVPTDLWPWTEILLALQAAPAMAPAELAVALAGYLPSGSDGMRSIDDVAQSVLDLARADEAVQALDAWSAAVLARYDVGYDVQQAIQKALRTGYDSVLRLQIPGIGDTDYVDLPDLVRRFVVEYALVDVDKFLALLEGGEAGLAYADAELLRLTARLLQAVWPGGAGSLVVHSHIEGFDYGSQPGGLSIYLPALDDPWREIKEISPQYGNLDLSDTAWPELICKLYEKDGLPQAFTQLRDERRAGETGGEP